LKDEHEIGSVRPEAKGVRKDEAGERPRFLSLVLDLKWRNRRRADGNVPIPLGLRDWQGAVGRVENLILVFQAFHGPGISSGFRRRYWNRGGTGNCVLQRRKSFALAALIRRAHSVSLIASDFRSIADKLTPGFRNFSASGSDCSFSKGVR